MDDCTGSLSSEFILYLISRKLLMGLFNQAFLFILLAQYNPKNLKHKVYSHSRLFTSYLKNYIYFYAEGIRRNSHFHREI